MKIINYRYITRLLLCALFLHLFPAYAIEDPFKKVGQWFETAAKDVGKGLSSAATSIKTFAEKTAQDIAQYATLSGPKMVEALRGQVNTLKALFKEHGGRIITGNLPMKDKVAVFGTITAIVTLTALVAGVSIVSIKNKQEEAIAQKAKEISDKTSSGIKEIFIKAKNALDQFDENLKSLGQCLKTGSCTQGQKQFLYGASITVAALTLLAIGIGVGAIFYKKHQEQKAQAAAAKEQEELQAQPSGTTPTPSTQTSAQPTLEIDPFEPNPAPESMLSAWQRKFQEKISIINTNDLRNFYENIKQKISQGALKTKEKVGETYNQLINKMSDFGSLLKQTFNVQLDNVAALFKRVKETLDQAIQIIKSPVKYNFGSFTGQLDDLVTYLKNIVHADEVELKFADREAAHKKEIELLALNYDRLIKAGVFDTPREQLIVESISGEKQPFFFKVKALFKKGMNPELQPAIKQYEAKRAAVESENDKLSRAKIIAYGKAIIKDVHTPKALNALVQELTAKINNLDLTRVGKLSSLLLQAIAKVVDASKSLHSAAGSVGAIIVNTELQDALATLSTRIQTLATNLAAFSTIQPLIIAPPGFTITSTIKTGIKALTQNFFGFIRNKKSEFEQLIPDIRKILLLIDPIEVAARQFQTHLQNVGTETKTEFLRLINEAPLKNIPKAAGKLRQALGVTIKSTKLTLNRLFEKTIELLETARNVAPRGLMLINELDTQMTAMVKQPFFNSQTPVLLKKMIENIITIYDATKKVATTIRQSESAL